MLPTRSFCQHQLKSSIGFEQKDKHQKATTDIDTFFPFAACFLESWSKEAMGFRQRLVIQVANQQKMHIQTRKKYKQNNDYLSMSICIICIIFLLQIWDDMSLLLLKWILCPCGLLNNLWLSTLKEIDLWIDRIQTTNKPAPRPKLHDGLEQLPTKQPAWLVWVLSEMNLCEEFVSLLKSRVFPTLSKNQLKNLWFLSEAVKSTTLGGKTLLYQYHTCIIYI